MSDFEYIWDTESDGTYTRRQRIVETPAPAPIPTPAPTPPPMPEQPSYGPFEAFRGENVARGLGGVASLIGEGFHQAGRAFPPAAAALDLASLPAQSLVTGAVRAREGFEPGAPAGSDFLSGLGEGAAGALTRSMGHLREYGVEPPTFGTGRPDAHLIESFRRYGMEGPAYEGLAVAGEMAMDPLNYVGAAKGLAESARLLALRPERARQAGGLIAGARPVEEIYHELDNSTRAARTLQGLNEGLDGTVAPLADLVSPQILISQPLGKMRLAYEEAVASIPSQIAKAHNGLEWARRQGVAHEDLLDIVTQNMDALRKEFHEARLQLPRELRDQWKLPALSEPLPLRPAGERASRIIRSDLEPRPPQPIGGEQLRLFDPISVRPQSVPLDIPSPPPLPAKGGMQRRLDVMQQMELPTAPGSFAELAKGSTAPAPWQFAPIPTRGRPHELEPGVTGYRIPKPSPPPGTLREDWLDPARTLDDILADRIVEARTQIAQMQLVKLALPYAEIASEETADAVRKGIFTGLKFTPEDARLLGNLVPREMDATERALRGALPTLAHAADVPAGIMRTTALGVDDAWSGLQGLPLLMKHPNIWMEELGRSFQVLADPEKVNAILGSPPMQYVIEHSPGLILEGLQYGRKPEFFSATAAIGKIPLLGPPAEWTLERLGNAFVASGNLARVRMAEAMLPAATRANMNPHRVDFINHMSGAIDTAAMGVSTAQRAVESGMLTLAPRYLRSVLAVVGDLFNSGSFADSMWTLSSLFAGGTYQYTRLALASGQTPIYDLRDPDAYTLDVGGQRVGIGSTIRALTKLMAQVATDPQTLLTDAAHNPLLTFWRNRLPLGSAQAYDWAMREDIRYNPINTPIDWLAALGRKFLPAVIDGLILERGDPMQKLTGAAASTFGLRSNIEGLRDVRDKVSAELFQGRKYLDLNPLERRQVDEDPRSAEIKLPEGPTFARQRLIKVAHQEYRDKIEEYASKLQSGSLNGTAFRQRVGEAAQDRNTQLDMIDRLHPEAVKRAPLNEAVAEDQRKQEVFKQYLNKLRTENPANGLVDRDAAEDFKNTQSPADQKYIDQRFEASIKSLGPQGQAAMSELRRARDVLQPYWETRKQVMERYGEWDRFAHQMTQAQQADYMRTPQYLRMERVWSTMRDALRWRDPEIDAALVKFYGATPIRMRRR